MKLPIVRIRRLHLYMGVVFAPMLLFFAISGAWQTFELQSGSDEHPAPKVLSILSDVHTSQHMQLGEAEVHSSKPFQWFVVAMTFGFIATTILGVLMAFQFTKEKWKVWACLAAGFLLPVMLLYIGGGVK
ncbi:MAG: hypothetical protein K1X53_15125 [Candidatus Sumerlaeaceae bacterium]|nr:hypothetical protein [Candidatus Sumerlaeaceae bacterium]